jgi:hypothetical protein
MAEIKEQFTIVRRLLPPESLPWSQLILPTVIERLRQRYKFEEIDRPEDEGSDEPPIVANGGEFVMDGIPYGIQQLALEANVVQTHSSGDRRVAELLFNDLKQFILEIDPARVICDEYLKTFQTIAMAKLSVPFDAVFSKKFLSFRDKVVAKTLSTSSAKAHITQGHLSFKISYISEEAEFIYIPKPLTIEPRSGSKLSDQIYYTHSPTDSDTHRKLLEDFEKSLA